MQYTVILSPTTDGTIAVSVPLMPNWSAKAKTRHEAISSARAALSNFINQSEILAIDVPVQNTNTEQTTVPWEWFGVAQTDPTWDELFDDIEESRNSTRKAD